MGVRIALLASMLFSLSLLAACDADEGGAASPGDTVPSADTADVTTPADTASPEDADTPSEPDWGPLEDTFDPDFEVTDDPENLLDGWTYLIVTNEEMRASFEKLADWRRQLGVPSRVVTMEEVLDGATSVDKSTTLRDFIRTAVEQHGTEIVLLGGDTPMVPHRSVYVHTAVGAGDLTYETSGVAPTDFYYSDLDGDWDGDGDGELAEFEDDLDMIPDVAVGRVPARSAADADAYIAKVLAYERAEKRDYQKKVLFISEATGWGQIDSSMMLDPWAKQIFGDDYEIQKLYDNADRFPDAQPSTRPAQIAALDEGRGITVHLGHGNEWTFAYLDGDDVAALDNDDRQNVFLSCACFSGNFGTLGEQATGERFVMNPGGGGVAYVGNTDIGMGFPSGGLYIAELSRRLLDDDTPPIGVAFADARLTYVPDGGGTWQDDHPDRYTQFVIVLLGDPGMRVWRTTPRPLRMTAPTRIASGGQLTVEVRDAAEQPVAGATVTLYQRDQLLHVTTTGDDGQVRLEHMDTRPGQLTVTATGVDRAPAEATVYIQ